VRHRTVELQVNGGEGRSYFLSENRRLRFNRAWRLRVSLFSVAAPDRSCFANHRRLSMRSGEAAAIAPGLQSHVRCARFSGFVLRLTRWESLKSNFQKWQSDARGKSRRHSDVRQSRPPVVGPSSARTVGINSETVGWMCTVFFRVVYGTLAAITSIIE
jgi:hypothetical protein